MKRVTFISAFFLLNFYSYSQTNIDSAKIFCNFTANKKISITILSLTKEASQHYRKLVVAMFTYAGLPNAPIFIGNTTSADLDYACTGFNQKNQPSIIINEAKMNTLPKPSIVSILAHEMGHYGNRHIDSNSPMTREMELAADWHGGFWCSRNGYNKIDSICFPYSLVRVDSAHPEAKIRIAEFKKGYEAGKTLAINNLTEFDFIETRSYLMVDPFGRKTLKFYTYKDYFDLVVTVNPNFRIINGVKKYDVFLNVVNTNSPQSSGKDPFANISFVRYVIDTTFGNRPKDQMFVVRDRDSGFEFKCRNVWGDFPITAIIRFSDYTEKSITKTFNLPD